MAMAFESREAQEESFQGASGQTKTCPRCGAQLFADMDICYGCLYDFKKPGLSYSGSGMEMESSGYTRSSRTPTSSETPPRPRSTSRSMSSPSAEHLSNFAPNPSGAPPEASGVAASQTAQPGVFSPAPASISVPAPAPALAASPGSLAASASSSVPAPAQAALAPLSVPAQGFPNAAPPSGYQKSVPSMSLGSVNSGVGALRASEVAPSTFAASSPVPSNFAPASGELSIGLAVRWCGLEVVLTLSARDLTVGSDRANDVTLYDFSLPSQCLRIRASEEGAVVELADPRTQALLDGVLLQQQAVLKPGHVLDLSGARFSLVRIDH